MVVMVNMAKRFWVRLQVPLIVYREPVCWVVSVPRKESGELADTQFVFHVNHGSVFCELGRLITNVF